MGDVFADLLPFLQGMPGYVVAAVFLRLFLSSAKELRVERVDHELTQKKLDVERDVRRGIEDKVDLLSREVRALTAEVSRLRTLLGEPT